MRSTIDLTASGSMPLGDGRVAGEVGEQDRRLAPLLGQRATTGPPAAGLGGDPATEEPRALAARLRGRLRWGRGGRRRCRLGGRARSAQRSAALDAELGAGGLSAPHEGHLAASCAPQDMQKRAPEGFSVPQFGQASPATSRTIRGRHARYVRIVTRCKRIGEPPGGRGGADRARRHPGQPVRAPPHFRECSLCALAGQTAFSASSERFSTYSVAKSTLDARAPPWVPPFFRATA